MFSENFKVVSGNFQGCLKNCVGCSKEVENCFHDVSGKVYGYFLSVSKEVSWVFKEVIFLILLLYGSQSRYPRRWKVYYLMSAECTFLQSLSVHDIGCYPIIVHVIHH